MSVIDQILSGSLLSSERLMQAREFYAPTRAQLPSEAAYARWTQRVAAQSELDSARELAGLSDEELTGLEAEFIRCPHRRRSDHLRHAIPIGSAMVLLGAMALALSASFAGLADGGPLMKGLGIALIVAGVSAVAVGAFAAFSMLHLDLSYGTTGLFVGLLDEQHPWLYRTMRLARHAPAEEYRQRVLRDRGALRGIDCVLMRELVRAQEVMEDTRPARSVAEQLQSQPVRVELSSVQEPRLVRVATRNTNRPRVSNHSTN